MKTRILPVFVMFVMTSCFLSAQSIAIGPQVGIIKSVDADNSSIMPGVAVRLDLLAFGLEGSIYYKTEEFNNGLAKTKSYPINLTALISILPIIHGEAGVGWYNTQIDFSHPVNSISTETKNKPGYHIGAGITIPAGNMLLTGDIRYVFLDLSSAVTFNSDFYVIMIGVMFKL